MLYLAGGAQAAPALVTQVHGSVRTKQVQMALLDRVEPGAVFELEAGALVVLFYPDRVQQFNVAGPGRFVASAADVQRQSGAGTVTLVRQDPAFGMLRPGDHVVAGAVVRSGVDEGAERIARARPVLQWRARPHRGPWQVRVTDGAGQVLFATVLPQTTLTLPPALLQPGHQYRRELRWESRDGATQVEVSALATLDIAAEAEAMRLAPAPDADGATRVLYALYLRALGVHGLAAQVAPELNQLNLTQ